MNSSPIKLLVVAVTLVLLISQSLCQNCTISSSCKQCSEDNSSCVSCNEGFYRSVAKAPVYECYECPTGCVSCSYETCSACSEGYFLNNKMCFKCSLSQRGCSTCSNMAVCESCEKGYTFNNGKCSLEEVRPCSVKNCASCVPEGDSCSQCKKKFFRDFDVVNELYSCDVCPTNCEVCYNKNQCSECILGFELNNGTCEQAFQVNTDREYYKIAVVLGVMLAVLGLIYLVITCRKQRRYVDGNNDKYILLGDQKKNRRDLENERTQLSFSAGDISLN
jgi:hypothetical protein